MIQIQDLRAGAGEKKILKGVSLGFQPGKNYCILGKNGSGKSTLSAVVSGSPKYEVESGSISISNSSQNLTPNPLSCKERGNKK